MHAGGIRATAAGAAITVYGNGNRLANQAEHRAGPPAETRVDTVDLSGDLRRISRTSLLLPTIENVNALTARFSGALGAALAEAGIAATPPFELTENADGTVTAHGERDDLAAIEAVVNGNEDLRRLHHNATAVASHAYAMEDALAFHREYRAAADPQAVIRKYAYLFSGSRPKTTISMVFGEKGAELRFNGEPWAKLAQASAAD